MSPWNCSFCGQVHRTPADQVECAQNRKRHNLWLHAIVVGVMAIVTAAMIGWAVYAYGDWTCAFAECRKVKL